MLSKFNLLSALLKPDGTSGMCNDTNIFSKCYSHKKIKKPVLKTEQVSNPNTYLILLFRNFSGLVTLNVSRFTHVLTINGNQSYFFSLFFR